MTFACLGALIADFRAKPAEGLGPLRVAAKEFGGKDTHIRAIAAQSDATRHQIIMTVMLHADHVIGTRLADLRA
jgi:hypothetical protein